MLYTDGHEVQFINAYLLVVAEAAEAYNFIVNWPVLNCVLAT